MWGGVVGGASSKEASTVEAEGKAHAERTLNIFSMLVTRDVSRLSGWLNARASCQVTRESMEEGRHAGKQAGGWGGVVGCASGREAQTVEAEAHAERTQNMYAMSVTLDVSKLSGWLNARTYCQVERGSIGGGATCGQAGRRVGWGGWWRKQQGGLDCGG